MALSLVLPAGALDAQSRPQVEIQLPASARLGVEGPVVRAVGMLASSRMRELLVSGFPARLHYRVELWADGRWVDELQRTAEWDVVVRYRPAERQYEVVQLVGPRPLSLGLFTRVEDAESAVARPLRVPMTPPAGGRRYYYRVTLDVETLSISDLDEVERWLRGDLSPAVRGSANAGSAVTRGIRTLTARLLGGERREYGARTSAFTLGS